MNIKPYIKSSLRIVYHNIFLLLACTTILVTSNATASEWNIEQLMQNLALGHHEHASFTEKKSMAMLDKPVESSGELFYKAPDYLEKRTLKPKSESMIINGNALIVERGHKKYRLQLQSYPELAAFIDSVRGTLSGNIKALQRNYQLSLEGTEASWTLQLSPLDKKMQAILKCMYITGMHDQVHGIEIIQADGDSSLMTIEKLDTP